MTVNMCQYTFSQHYSYSGSSDPPGRTPANPSASLALWAGPLLARWWRGDNYLLISSNFFFFHFLVLPFVHPLLSQSAELPEGDSVSLRPKLCVHVRVFFRVRAYKKTDMSSLFVSFFALWCVFAIWANGGGRLVR